MQVVAVMMKAGGAGLVLPYASEFRDLIDEIGSSNVSRPVFSLLPNRRSSERAGQHGTINSKPHERYRRTKIPI